jgi:hypothetical protein
LIISRGAGPRSSMPCGTPTFLPYRPLSTRRGTLVSASASAMSSDARRSSTASKWVISTMRSVFWTMAHGCIGHL